jgi:hypothetical protein
MSNINCGYCLHIDGRKDKDSIAIRGNSKIDGHDCGITCGTASVKKYPLDKTKTYEEFVVAEREREPLY